ncbi:MAG: RtcB family protein [Actinomycetota bacterium]
MPELIATNVLSWASDLDTKTREQAERTADLPFVEQPLALMADAHLGYGATVGSVIATDGAIIPSAVGVDIGCGMAAAPTGLTAANLPDDLGAIHTSIARGVPAGVPRKGRKHQGAHRDPVESSTLDGLMARAPAQAAKDTSRVGRQFGTLGSGNHFVELCLDEHDEVWVVLHSGSRGIGNALAQTHIEAARGLMKRYFIELEDPDLAYLVEGTPEFAEYIDAMLWAQDYAKANRDAMLAMVLRAVMFGVGRGEAGLAEAPTHRMVNCHHNYTEREHHHGRELWVTRKGAIRACVGDCGVIPGSMATGSFIVEGLGNPASYTSASHGAGRKLSRTAARRQLSEDSLNELMDGIAWNEDARGLLDEHPEAYKDIESVMDAQADLVSVTHRLTTILNYKGA